MVISTFDGHLQILITIVFRWNRFSLDKYFDRDHFIVEFKNLKDLCTVEEICLEPNKILSWSDKIDFILNYVPI